MARVVIRHKETGKFRTGRGWRGGWSADLQHAVMFGNAGGASQSVKQEDRGKIEYLPAFLFTAPPMDVVV